MVEFSFIMKEVCKYAFIIIIGFGVFFGGTSFLMNYMEETGDEEGVAWTTGGLATVLYFIFIFWVFH